MSLKALKLLRILLIEDDDSHAKIIERTFARENIKSTICRVKDGDQGLRALRGEGGFLGYRPDLILLDLNLPKIDGFEVLRNIKADQELKTIPVVILTTSDANQDRILAGKLRANSYLVKPADTQEIKKVISDLNLDKGALSLAVSLEEEYDKFAL